MRRNFKDMDQEDDNKNKYLLILKVLCLYEKEHYC